MMIVEFFSKKIDIYVNKVNKNIVAVLVLIVKNSSGLMFIGMASIILS
ncbi:hypothetical protein [Acaryochloris marina]|nr:hypothetical protein [Acaryochloris marina]